jgi:hypothetical protein
VTEPREKRLLLALVDVSLADCDHLDRVAGGRCEVALVVVPDAGAPVARWAEVAGYPCTTDLRRLSAVVADAVAVGGASARREDALAIASLTGARAAVLPPAHGAHAAADAAPPTGAAARRLDTAFDELFGAAGDDRP